MKRYIKSTVIPLDQLDWRDQLAVAEDPNTDIEALRILANQDKLPLTISGSILANPKVTSDIIDIMTTKLYFEDIYDRIAGHPMASKFALDKVADYALLGNHFNIDYWALQDVAINENTSLKTLRKLAKCSSCEIRNKVAEHPNASTSLLSQMCDRDLSIAPYAVQNPNISLDIVERLANSSRSWGREVAASCPKASADILLKLSQDEKPIVRMSVAENKSTPVEILQTLLNDSDYSVRLTAEETLRKCNN